MSDDEKQVTLSLNAFTARSLIVACEKALASDTLSPWEHQEERYRANLRVTARRLRRQLKALEEDPESSNE